MTVGDKILVWVGLCFATFGIFTPTLSTVVAMPVHPILVVCTAVGFVCTMAVLIRGAFPSLRGKG